jgi:hypothetical protein
MTGQVVDSRDGAVRDATITLAAPCGGSETHTGPDGKFVVRRALGGSYS